MNKGILALIACLGVVGCNDGSKIEQAVRENLNDPDSAKFRGLTVSEDGRMACISWNAKNMMGGYGQWKFARLEEKESGWFVENIEIPESQCSEAALKSIKIGDVAQIDASQKAIEMLQVARGITREEASKLAHFPSGECGDLVHQYSFNQSMIESSKVVGDSRKAEGYSKNIEPLENMLKQGDCDKGNFYSLKHSLWPFGRKG